MRRLLQKLRQKKLTAIACLTVGMVIGGYGLASAAGPSGSPAVQGNHVTCTTSTAGACSFTYASPMPVAPDSVVVTPSIPTGGTAYTLTVVNGSLTATGGQVKAFTSSGAAFANRSITFDYQIVGSSVPATTSTTIQPTTTTQPITTTTQPITTTTQPITTTTQPITTTTQPITTTTQPSGQTLTCEDTTVSGQKCRPNNFVLTSDGWNNGASPSTYDLKDYNNSEQDWTDTVTTKACACVVSYPSVEAFTLLGAGDGAGPAVSSTPLTSTYAENMNPNSGSVTHAMWDVWTGPSSSPWKNETAIEVDHTSTDPIGMECGSFSQPVIDGVTWDFCGGTSGERTFYLPTSQPTGSVNIGDMMAWEQANGKIPTTDLYGEVDFGWEILSTNNQPQTFAITGYTLTGFTPVSP